LGDVAKGRLCLRGVDDWIDEPCGSAVLLISKRKKASIERGNGTGPANHKAVAVNKDGISGGRIGISGNIGDSSAARSIGSLRNACT